ncbi:DUF917 domain-containing protein [Peribacillus simplex]|uniref:DUF917 domain-containing protein n=1 Tax=Peribacillus simplex TaxID=1478 RepID=UPI0024BFCFB9|nr:DUF917 domain-containing protein [Peribacillus simplex]WHY95414.1 DUF917 domain-containing protein [Peribacillus simplex]
MRTLHLQEVEDILYGACIYGTGGGGSLDEGLALVRELYKAGKQVTILTLDEVKDNWLVASPYYVGSVAPPSKEVSKRLENLTIVKENVSTIAARALQEHLGEPIQAVIATELGGNTAWAMETAASLGVPLIDADPVGRAVPDLAHTTFNIFDVSITPFSLANKYGDTVIVETAVNHDRAEQIARSFATISGNFSGVCDHPIKGEKLKNSVIPGTLTQAERVGRAMRLANDQGASPVNAVILAGKGKLLTEGIVSDATWADTGGFIEGSIAVQSINNDIEDTSLNIWFRNEYMIAKHGEEIVSVIPELIVILDRKNGVPILNPTCTTGMEVAVVTFPAPKVWESDKGLSIFGPEYIGLNRSTYFEVKKEDRCLKV